MASIGTALALGASLAPACGGGIQSSCGDYFDALISVQNQCGDPDVLVNESERDDFIAYCEAGAAAPGSSNMASQLDTCASDLETRGCIGILYQPPSCLFRGTLPDGSACASSEQCAGGICSAPTTPNPSSEVVCGTCATFLAVGAACTAPFPPCDPTTSQCDGATCVANIPVGGTCPAANTYCAGGYECSSGGVCVSVPTLGQSCNSDCNGPYDCSGGICVARGTQGVACASPTDCGAGLTCDAQQQCQPPTPAALGQPCGFEGTGGPCDTGLVCSLESMTCISPVPTGGACTVGQFQCSPYAACINGVCSVPDPTACK